MWKVCENEQSFVMKSMLPYECIKYASDFEHGEKISLIVIMYRGQIIVSFVSDSAINLTAS